MSDLNKRAQFKCSKGKVAEEACFLQSWNNPGWKKTPTKLPINLYKLLSCPNPHLKQVLLGQVAQGLDFQNSAGWKLYSPSGHVLCLTILRVKKVLSYCFLLLFAVHQHELCIFSACEREVLKKTSKSGKLLHVAPRKCGAMQMQ